MRIHGFNIIVLSIESFFWVKGKSTWVESEVTRVDQLDLGPSGKRDMYYFIADGEEYRGAGRAQKAQTVFFDQNRPSRNSLLKEVTASERISMFINPSVGLLMLYLAIRLLERG